MQQRWCSLLSVLAIATVAAACGGGDSDSAATTAPAVCSYNDAGNGNPIEGEAGGTLTDSRGMSYTIGSDCTLEFAGCEVTLSDGQVYTGQPQETFTGPDGAAMMFSASCAPVPDASQSPLSAEVVAACDSVGGTITIAVSDSEWGCGEIDLGDNTDSLGDVEAALAPYCVEPDELTSGISTSEAPFIAGWACSPPADIVEGDTVDAVCATLAGTLQQTGPEDWTCNDVPLGETTDTFGDFYDSLFQFCVTDEFNSTIFNAEQPYTANYSCTSAPTDGTEESATSPTLETLCTDLGGTIEVRGQNDWTCGDVPLGDTTDAYAAIDAELSRYCEPPAAFTSGMLTAAAPWLAGWSCTPA
jgi:hypothetical protein